MARTSLTVSLGRKSVDDILNIFAQVMAENKYENKLVNGENIWAKGDGIIMKRQCFAVSFSDDNVLLQGWMHDAVTGESDLNGFVAMVPKKKMKKIMDEIINKIQF